MVTSVDPAVLLVSNSHDDEFRSSLAHLVRAWYYRPYWLDLPTSRRALRHLDGSRLVIDAVSLGRHDLEALAGLMADIEACRVARCLVLIDDHDVLDLAARIAHEPRLRAHLFSEPLDDHVAWLLN